MRSPKPSFTSQSQLLIRKPIKLSNPLTISSRSRSLRASKPPIAIMAPTPKQNEVIQRWQRIPTQQDMDKATHYLTVETEEGFMVDSTHDSGKEYNNPNGVWGWKPVVRHPMEYAPEKDCDPGAWVLLKWELCESCHQGTPAWKEFMGYFEECLQLQWIVARKQRA
ncbi:uncharacterized protein PAC_14650 [Phialocephala subalpina]|uniref:Uncharacterized protein n=1 Tax=Phialocephala subalpina TaxID=576137 RepID=A0A1L7XI91_9HELO|nr:uncharacterized protein PAC_14650 [Phialocephala subalpina]